MKAAFQPCLWCCLTVEQYSETRPVSSLCGKLPDSFLISPSPQQLSLLSAYVSPGSEEGILTPPLLLSEMADPYTCKGGRKTAGSNKPAASKESRTETRINPPTELPRLGREWGFSFRGGGWGGRDELRGSGTAAKHGGVNASGLGEPLLHVLDQKSPRTLELQRAGAWEWEGTH